VEITEVLSKHQNEVTYDALQEMPYLDMVVSGEGLKTTAKFHGDSKKLA
jgi:hypothetical protein